MSPMPQHFPPTLDAALIANFGSFWFGSSNTCAAEKRRTAALNRNSPNRFPISGQRLAREAHDLARFRTQEYDAPSRQARSGRKKTAKGGAVSCTEDPQTTAPDSSCSMHFPNLSHHGASNLVGRESSEKYILRRATISSPRLASMESLPERASSTGSSNNPGISFFAPEECRVRPYGRYRIAAVQPNARRCEREIAIAGVLDSSLATKANTFV